MAAFGLAPTAASAAAPGIPFGAAMQNEYFDADPEYRQAFLDQCDLIMPMNELKFGLVQWERGVFDFSRADRIVDFAREHGKTSRGHTFVWYQTNPPWLDEIEGEREAETVLREHVERVADHFRGRLTSWDVVNEVIAHEPRAQADGPLRDTVWSRLLGPRHVPIAFEAAARADPGAGLVVNDYELEFAGDRYDARRAVMLDIVRQLQDGNFRVDAVGLQAHLYSHLRIDIERLGRFKRDLEALGVGLVVTELDIIDFQVRGGVEEQEAAAAKIVSDLCDAVLPGNPPSAFVTWGITDRYSWVPEAMPREDGSASRPLPLDVDMRPKQWYSDLRARLRSGR